MAENGKNGGEQECADVGHVHSSHHSHEKKSSFRILKHKIKKTLRKNFWIVPLTLVVLLVLAGVGYWVVNGMQSQVGYRLEAGSQTNVGSGYRDVSYQGKQYRYNNRITSILYAGVDSDGDLAPNVKYASAPRADSISLVVLDELNRKMTIVALSRDTITKIRKYTLNGKDRGMLTDHLGYAYSYGDGGEVSCKDLCESVSNLLYGIPIHEYVISNRSSLPVLSRIIGPVSVTVPNNDLAGLGFEAGQTVTIDAKNLETFVRSRDTAEDLSNVGRMERQQAYINGAVEQIRAILNENPSEAWKKLEAAESCMQTNITRARYLDLARVLQNTSYGEGDYYLPEGRQVVASDHDEFYPDEDKLLEKVIEIFYIEK